MRWNIINNRFILKWKGYKNLYYSDNPRHFPTETSFGVLRNDAQVFERFELEKFLKNLNQDIIDSLEKKTI